MTSTHKNTNLPFSGKFRGLPESPARVPKLEAKTPVEHMWKELESVFEIKHSKQEVFTYSVTPGLDS